MGKRDGLWIGSLLTLSVVIVDWLDDVVSLSDDVTELAESEFASLVESGGAVLTLAAFSLERF